MNGQIPLNLAPEALHDFSSFEVGESNEAAVKAITMWPKWPSPILLLLGPKGSGKTHLGRAWASQNHGFVLDKLGSDFSSYRGYPVFLDDAHTVPEETLFTLMNMALNGHMSGLLLSSRISPSEWPIELPDLRSRLSNTPLTRLHEAGADILELVVRKLFEDQGRLVSQDVVTYLLAHCDRSIHAMRRLVGDLDLEARQAKKDITRPFIVNYLRSMT